MYPNLNAEMSRRNITRGMLAKELGVTLSTLCLKLNGKYKLTLPECKQIKAFLNVNISLDELFEEVDTCE